MDQAQARRSREDAETATAGSRSLHAVPDDLTPAERRDWQALVERRKRERSQPSPGTARRRHAAPRPTSSVAAAPPDPVVADRGSPPAPSGRGGSAPQELDRRPGPVPEPRQRAERVRTDATSRARPGASRRPQRQLPSLSLGAQPDRLALWAVVMCLFMALVAAATARGAEGPDAAPALAPDTPAGSTQR